MMKMIDKIYVVIKKVKLRNIIILILILAFNAYAWFIYATKVATAIDVRVSSWNVEFLSGEESVGTNMQIELDRIYPGMEKFEKDIQVNNTGEIDAYLKYEIQSLKILGDTYNVSDDGVTSEELKNKLKEYPFKISVEKSEETLEAKTGTGNFKITVEWPFESGDDQLDTFWGNKAYEYYSLNPNEKSILINIDLIAVQKG